jgi:deoxyribodipyrimidine photo-lyase
MQQSQRAGWNPALEYAVARANELSLPLVVGFGLDGSYPDANRRHFAFMLEGLAETARELRNRGIAFVARRGSPPGVAADLGADAALVVCDRGYLRHQRRWREDLARELDCALVQVEGDVVVPVDSVSGKREWAARTIRKKILSVRDDFLSRQGAVEARCELPAGHAGDGIEIEDPERVLDELDVDASVPPVARFTAGSGAARNLLTAFLRSHLPGYSDKRNDPANPHSSELSPYLHFGQISPVEIAWKVNRSQGPSDEDKAAFLEELVVRRELACNFTRFEPDYDRYSSLPDWALETLADHADDEREHVYTRKELEQGQTHDRYWNAAMREMRETGYMHNYMRMYWGKKIIEWTNTPEYAYRTALCLNNRYFLDGRDPNSYANVGWLFGLHDRAWTERDIFGKVRYMNANGLESKFDMAGYIERVDALAEKERS